MNQFYLDIGNTHYKLASYGDRMWTIIAEGSIDEPGELSSAMKDARAGGRVIISSVRKDILTKIQDICRDLQIQVLGSGDIPSGRLDYQTPHSLGVDRYLAALAAHHESGKSVVVVDAGSAITMDYMDERGVFMGGVIMPGLRILNRSVSDHLPELPATDVSVPGNWPGKSSKECLEWGLYGSLHLTLNGFIQKYMEMGTDPDIYLTGGDSIRIKSFINPDLPVHLRPFLLFDGMRLFAES